VSINKNLSIEQLENDFWSEPEYKSSLVINCHKLRKIPIGELTVENIRMLVAQKIGLEYVVPIAIEYLEENPWCSGDFYDCDLLQNVLDIDVAFWCSHSDLIYKLSEVMTRVQTNIKLFNENIFPAWTELSKNWFD